MDIKNRIEVAKVNLQKAEQARIVAQTQKESAEKTLEDVKAEMAAEGVTPETIDQEIANLQDKITESLARVESLVPRV